MHAKSRWGLMAGLMVIATPGLGAEPTDAASYLSVRAASVALRHVEIIDGTGAAPRADQTLVIVGDRIAAVGSDSGTAIPADALVKDYAG